MDQPDVSQFAGAKPLADGLLAGVLAGVLAAPEQRDVGPSEDIIDSFLRAARTHLGLQVAYVSEFCGNDALYRHVDAPGLEALIKPGDRRSLDDVYCRHILSGALPELIPDTAAEPLAVAMPITSAVPIGAHVSVPLRLEGGELFGMFCCLGPAADTSLTMRDLGIVRVFAQMAAAELQRRQATAVALAAKRAPVARMIDGGGPDMVYQPIYRIGAARAGPVVCRCP
ncbi:GAF domain-containing protein [Polymorphobacter multimanifer]|uniref:GAF domain-containing protein n=1 Tax=Polymorphobacter multimanifer TaxID=1070431 RepID=A0A841L7L2_9SPHN|nr:GAF domain-containing protein [Polymorphobacter multimanifer]MBB6228420.1 GAF domain-containing protein [Polymorphobacter multimanifer]